MTKSPAIFGYIWHLVIMVFIANNVYKHSHRRWLTVQECLRALSNRMTYTKLVFSVSYFIPCIDRQPHRGQG